MWSSFETKVPGKWVLAGEHAVLRGATAIALPHPEFELRLSFETTGRPLSVQPKDAEPVIKDLLDAIEDKLAHEDRPFSRPQGDLRIESTIPVGAGLGSSAALCVALTRWMAEPLSLPASELLEFARELEHRFHGRSSGMDVAVVFANKPISFVMGRGAQTLGLKKLPRFTFHDIGLRARTSDCVMRVEGFREETPVLGMQTDDAMSMASRQAVEGLIRFDSGSSLEARKEALALLASAMKRAQECFYVWGLVPREAKEMEEQLLSEGALAVKITGAGGGGFLVALWGENGA